MIEPTKQPPFVFQSIHRTQWSGLARAASSFLLILILSSQGLAQQATPSINRLKEQIVRMEQVDRDPLLPEEVKAINRRLLNERQQQLRSLLERSIEALRKYQSDPNSLLSAQETEDIAAAIAKFNEELSQLQPNSGAATEAGRSESNGNGSGAASSDLTTQAPANAKPPSNEPGEGSRVALVTPQPMPEGANATTQADCYSDAPPLLVDTAASGAFRVVRDGAGSIDLSLQRLIFFTIADAVSRAEKDEARRDLIRSIQIRQFMEETARTDKQIGASASSEGSTSAAEKPNFANLLALAIEHGAIAKEVNGTALTLSTSPYAILAAAQGDTSSNYKKYDFFRRVGISANFNIDDENNVLASARRHQLSEWSVRARLSGDRSTRSPEFEDFWNREVRKTFEQVPFVLVNEFATLFRNETEKVRRQVAQRFRQYAQEYLTNNAALSEEAKREGLQREILCRLKEEVFDNIDRFGLTEDDRQRIVARTLPALQAATQSESAALALVDQKIKEMSLRPLATFAYTNKRDPDNSDYSLLKFLYERKTFNPVQLILNGGVSFYHKPNSALHQRSVRDIAFALSLEGKAGRSPFVNQELDNSQITFAFTGRYERMFENKFFADRKADLAFAQFRVEIPFMTGMSFPFSVTYANATELIKEDHLRANFGFSFDADKLLFIRSFLRKNSLPIQ